MKLSFHSLGSTNRWACNGKLLPSQISLVELLKMPREEMRVRLESLQDHGGISAMEAPETLLAPIEPEQEIWASGVTYLRSRTEREAESMVGDVYATVYEAERPELFFKALGWRTVGPDGLIRIRRDSSWNVPEPELTLVINAHREIIGYTAGNDVSSRSIEGENPLYLPQAKSYDGSCAIGREIILLDNDEHFDVGVELEIERDGATVFKESTQTGAMKRTFPELVEFLTREMTFPIGVFLMTGTGIVPSQPFTLLSNDIVRITVGETVLVNTVEENE